jgi:GNAT superfamily N-acetyltransferase
VRLLNSEDAVLIEKLLRTSEYVYQRFTVDELPLTLKRYPAVGIFNSMSSTALRAFLLSQAVNPPGAWIGGFGVGWGESRVYISYLDTLLMQLEFSLLQQSTRYLHYSGTDIDQDWLRPLLLTRGFVPHRMLYSYDKFDYSVPTQGNQQVTIRPVRFADKSPQNSTPDLNGDIKDDTATLLAIEALCFDDLWRYDATGFHDIAITHPYFVVAELNGQVVGYQFNTIDSDYGYLVRIAVHPSVAGQGIGARLMTEALRFFARARVSRIMLNTQEDNTHAHRLYEWFGFIRVHQQGFVLRKAL